MDPLVYQRAFNDSAVGLALTSIDGGWLDVNDAACGTFGYPRDALLRTSLLDLAYPEDRHALAEARRAVAAGELPAMQLESRYVHAAGNLAWVRLTLSLVRDREGAPGYLLHQLQDVSAEHAVESDAEEFFESSADMFAVTSDSGRLEHVNAAWEATLGWSREEMTSRPYLTFVHPEDVQRTNEVAEILVSQGLKHRFRNRYRTKAGGYRWLEWSTLPARPGKIFCVARDVTEQVEHVAQLRLFKLALAAAANGVLITNPNAEGNPIVYANPAFQRITGYEEVELLGARCSILQGSDRAQPAIAEMRAAIAAGRDCQVVVRNYRKDGTMFLNALTFAPVRDAEGRLTHYVGIVEDITARVAAEDLARRQSATIQAVVESMNDVVMVVDTRGQLVVLNEAAKTQFGPALQNGIPLEWEPGFGLFLADRVTRCAPDQYPLARALRGEVIEQQELWMRLPGWTEGRWHSVSGGPVRDSDGTLLGAVNVGRDITARKALEDHTQRAAVVDDLTGLYNRRGFMRLATQELKTARGTGRPLVLLFIDLDGMKVVNDRLGHEAGDQHIIRAARLLQASLRDAAALARLGGDEFVALTEGTPHPLIQRLRGALDEANDAPGGVAPLAMSIGWARFEPANPCSLAELMSQADRIMYEQKRARRSSDRVARSD